MRRVTAVMVTGLLVIGSTGCSQVDALAPVSGKDLVEARVAADDVLLTQHVAILTAPMCPPPDKGVATISCTGRTVANELITITVVPGPDTDALDVTVGSRSIYRGTVQDVLTAAAGPAS